MQMSTNASQVDTASIEELGQNGTSADITIGGDSGVASVDSESPSIAEVSQVDAPGVEVASVDASAAGIVATAANVSVEDAANASIAVVGDSLVASIAVVDDSLVASIAVVDAANATTILAASEDTQVNLVNGAESVAANASIEGVESIASNTSIEAVDATNATLLSAGENTTLEAASLDAEIDSMKYDNTVYSAQGVRPCTKDDLTKALADAESSLGSEKGVCKTQMAEAGMTPQKLYLLELSAGAQGYIQNICSNLEACKLAMQHIVNSGKEGSNCAFPIAGKTTTLLEAFATVNNLCA